MVNKEEFEKFLQSIDLVKYRRTYLPVKIVEMDMPKNVQAISLLYEIYAEKRQLINFEEFFLEYKKRYRKDLDKFREKTTMCKSCFSRGLPARIYRTWASILTQIHAGFVAESVFGKGNVEMSAELDHQGADFRVDYNGVQINYQVKKETYSREVRAEKAKPKKGLNGDFIDITYAVLSFDRIKNPYQKNRKDLYSDYKNFKENFIDTGYLKILKNGFVVFTPHIFEQKKKEIDQTLK